MPARISGRSVASARSATAQAAAIRSISSGCFSARRASTQPSTGTSSTSGAAASRRSQSACVIEAASTATRRAPTEASNRGHAPGRSYPTSSTSASEASRRAWIV